MDLNTITMVAWGLAIAAAGAGGLLVHVIDRLGR